MNREEANVAALGILGFSILSIAFWSGALVFLVLVAAFWLVDLMDRLRALRERRRHPEETAELDAVRQSASTLPALRADRPRFRLGPLRRYLGQGRVNPLDRNGLP